MPSFPIALTLAPPLPAHHSSRHPVPFFGLAGISGVNLAIFDNTRHALFRAGVEDFTSPMHDAPCAGWRPFIRIHSRHDNNWTCIYSSGSGASWKLFIAPAGRRAPAVLRLGLNQNAMLPGVTAPQDRSRKYGGD